MELPSSPAAPYQFEVENRKSRKRRPKSSDLRHAYDDTRYQASPQIASSSHYVHPHISAHREPSPSSHTSRLAYYENTVPPLDPYTLVEDTLREYSSGFVSGAEAALGMGTRRREPASHSHSSASRGAHSSGLQTVQSASTFEPADGYRPASTNVYHNQPYSAPVRPEVRPESPLHYAHYRQSTAVESSIVSSSPSHTRDSPPSRPRSRSHGARHSAASAMSGRITRTRFWRLLCRTTAPKLRPSRHHNGTSSSSPPCVANTCRHALR